MRLLSGLVSFSELKSLQNDVRCRSEPNQVRAVRAFLAGSATVPFIARYRKAATGWFDEVRVTAMAAPLIA
jgi:transcriptional accessory protein Tex/SPT6